MSTLTGDELSQKLQDGWVVSGYSVCMMAMGALAHNILLQKDGNLISITIGTNGGQELARAEHVFAPSVAPQPRKGFFG